MKSLVKLLLIAACVPALGQIPAPQVPVTGNLGPGGVFPLLNSGNLVMATDANYTMSYPDMTASFIKVTSGVSLTAQRNIVAPVALGFAFTIENSTSGGQSIQVIGASGTGVVIPNGSTVSVACDGINYVTAGSTSSGLPVNNPAFTGVLSGPDVQVQQIGQTFIANASTAGIDFCAKVASAFISAVAAGSNTVDATGLNGTQGCLSSYTTPTGSVLYLANTLNLTMASGTFLVPGTTASIIGGNKNTTVIVGTVSGAGVIQVNNPSATVSTLSVQNLASASGSSDISVNAQDVTVEHVALVNGNVPLYVAQTANAYYGHYTDISSSATAANIIVNNIQLSATMFQANSSEFNLEHNKLDGASNCGFDNEGSAGITIIGLDVENSVPQAAAICNNEGGSAVPETTITGGYIQISGGGTAYCAQGTNGFLFTRGIHFQSCNTNSGFAGVWLNEGPEVISGPGITNLSPNAGGALEIASSVAPGTIFQIPGTDGVRCFEPSTATTTCGDLNVTPSAYNFQSYGGFQNENGTVIPYTVTGNNGNASGVKVPLALAWNTPSSITGVCHDANGNLTDAGCPSGGGGLPACADTSGSPTAQSCTTSPTFTPAANSCVVYSSTTANTGAGLTINVNSLGAKSAAKWLGTTTLAAGDFPANKSNIICYDGTAWEAMTIANAPAGGAGTTTNALTVNNSGNGAGSGGTFNGSAPVTISSNTVGAQPSGVATISSASGAVTLGSVQGIGTLYINATGNITSSSCPTGAFSGQRLDVVLTQPGGGGVTVTWPSCFPNAPTVALEAAATTSFQTKFDGVNFNYQSATNSSGHGIQVQTAAPGANPAAGLLFPWPSSTDADMEWLNPAGGIFAGFLKGADCNPVTGICTKTNNVAFGTAATQNTGTSGANIPLLNAANTHSGLDAFSAGLNLPGASAPLQLAGSAGTAGQCPISGGAGVTPAWGACGSGGSGSGSLLNPSCTFVTTGTGCTINVAALTVATANVTSLIVQCATVTTGTYTNLVGTYTVTSSGGNLATVVTTFSPAAAGGSCTANATSGNINAGDGTVFASAPTAGALTLNTQTANTGLYGPVSGSAAAPTFRAEVAADLPVGTAITSTPVMGSSDTLACSTINTTYTTFATTISRPAFTQTAGAKWRLEPNIAFTSSGGALTFQLEVKDGSTVVYAGTGGGTINTALTAATLGAFVDEEVLTTGASGSIDAFPIGQFFTSTAVNAYNVAGTLSSYATNSSATLSVWMKCSTNTAGNSATLVSLTLVKVY